LADDDARQGERRGGGIESWSLARWLAGAAGLTVVGSVAGVSVARSLGRRVSADDPYAGEDFELLHDDRSVVVTANDGVPLAVRECGPENAPLTVVFAHGFCLRMGAFHFQRDRLAQQWGDQVRMVFYDQRGHGLSGDASPDTFTVPQLGQDLESVLAVMAPRGPVVLVGHSMGGMLAVRYALEYPEATERLLLVNPIGLEDYAAFLPPRTVDQWYAQELRQTPDSVRDYQRQA
jgi:predicted alpha/beta-fold hydrolase